MLKTKAMDMRRAQEPRAEAAIRNNDYAAQELNAAHPLPPGNLAKMAVASPLTSALSFENIDPREYERLQPWRLQARPPTRAPAPRVAASPTHALPCTEPHARVL